MARERKSECERRGCILTVVIGVKLGVVGENGREMASERGRLSRWTMSEIWFDKKPDPSLLPITIIELELFKDREK